MSTFPTSKDAFVNPTPTTPKNDPAVPLSSAISRLNSAVVAIQDTVGITASVDPASIQYRLADAQAVAAAADQAISAHVVAGDPHSQYTTQTEVLSLAPAETGSTIGALVVAGADVTSPQDVDLIPLAVSSVLRKFSWANLKAALAQLFPLLAGASGGQTINGGTTAAQNLTLRSTAHATKGAIIFGAASEYDEANNRLGIGTLTPDAKVHSVATTEQLRLGYDGTKYASATVNSSGDLTITPTGGKTGFGITPTAALHLKAGTAAAGTAPLKLVSGTLTTTPEAGAIEQAAGALYHTNDSGARRAIASEPFVAQYFLSGALNNGFGTLGNNRNFSAYTYDSVDRPSGANGSFRITGSLAVVRSDDLIQVDTSRRLSVSLLAKAGDIGGGQFNAGNKQYFGIEFYDIDGLAIGSEHGYSYGSAVDTTLAAPLNPGDTSVVLTSSSGWYNGSDSTISRMAWYGYADSRGYVYPDYTYSRNVSPAGSWAAGGISGNTITLSSPWAGPSLAAGAAVSNRSSGKIFNYFASNVSVPNSWTGYEGTLDGFGQNAYNYRHGTHYVKIGHLVNYHGSADTNVRIASVRCSQIASANLESGVGVGASYKSLRVAALPTNGLAVEGKLGAGTTSPSAQVHALATTEQLRLGYDASNYQSFTVNSTGVMTISGPIVLSPAASATPTVNNTLTIERTSNTQLTFRLKGSDGTVRSASLTLT